MDSLPLHPVLVHLPIALGVLMPLVAGGLLLAWWKGWLPRRSWLIVVVLQVVLVGSGLVAMRTGEADEERVEAVVAHAHIHAHEEAAEAFVWAAAATLLLAGGVLFVRKDKPARMLAAASTVAAVAVLVLCVVAGDAGGRLVYEHGAASAHRDAPTTPIAHNDAPPDADHDDG